MKKLIIAAMLLGSLFMSLGTSVSAQTNTHVVEKGDTLWKISIANGVSIQEVMNLNHLTSSLIYPGQKLKLPAPISKEDLDLLARLVHAEAKGESYAGKVAVVTVVLNRVDHKDFPDTIKEVIYQKVSGHYAFSPVGNGQIYNTPNAEDFRAVKEALAFRGQGSGSVFFYNPAKITSKWVLSREVTVTIGNHVFAK